MARPEKKLKTKKEFTVPKKKGGRPPIVYDQATADEIMRLASVGLTQERIGYVKGISHDSVSKYYSAAFWEGKNKGIAKLMKRAFDLAMSGNVAMLIFLLKTLCGLSEKQIVSVEGSLELPTPIFSTAKPKK